MPFDLKAATPDASFGPSAFLFGADSQSATDPSIYAWSTVRDHLWSLTQTFARGTITDPAPVIDASVTWNDAADTFTGFKLNVTNTASAATSMLMDLQVGGSSRFAVGRNGELRFPGTGDQQYITQNGQEILRSGSSVSELFTPKIFVANADIRSHRDAGGGSHFAARSSNGATTYFELFGEAADTLALRRGTNAQAFRLYSTFTDSSNYSRINFRADAGGSEFRIETEGAGTGSPQHLILLAGTSRRIGFRTSGASSDIWSIATSGHFLAGTDNTYDIGASGANRPRHIYAGSEVFCGSSGRFVFAGRSKLESTGDGLLTLYNQAGTDFNRLQFGGATASFPALKRDGVGLAARLADDSAATWLKVLYTTVAALPSASTAGSGAMAVVSDASAPTKGSTISGGGAVVSLVVSNGTNWIAA